MGMGVFYRGMRMFMAVAESLTFMTRVVMAVVLIRMVVHMDMRKWLMNVGMGVAFSE